MPHRVSTFALHVAGIVLATTASVFAASTFPHGPFDTKVSHPVIVAQSKEQIERVLGGETHHFGRMQFTGDAHDGGVPVYTAHETDPHYRIHCMKYSHCPVEGDYVAIPRGAKASGNVGNRHFEDDDRGDRHLAVRNLDTSIETDLWLASEPTGDGGTLEVGYGAKFPFSSNGVGLGGATAAGFALSVGRVSADELLAGRIDHAIFLVTPCENGHVAPAISDDHGRDAGCPPIGARLWLDSPESTIDRSGASRDARTILQAMHEYGGFIGDRCSSCLLQFATTGGVSDTSMGRANPWRAIAARYPDANPSGPRNEYHIGIETGSIDLAAHLHVIAWP
ncbi:MAG: hypothetical protein NVSMB59_21360 [Vulcanimicrobiaceae bacterium]